MAVKIALCFPQATHPHVSCAKGKHQPPWRARNSGARPQAWRRELRCDLGRGLAEGADRTGLRWGQPRPPLFPQILPPPDVPKAARQSLTGLSWLLLARPSVQLPLGSVGITLPPAPSPEEACGRPSGGLAAPSQPGCSCWLACPFGDLSWGWSSIPGGGVCGLYSG